MNHQSVSIPFGEPSGTDMIMNRQAIAEYLDISPNTLDHYRCGYGTVQPFPQPLAAVDIAEGLDVDEALCGLLPPLWRFAEVQAWARGRPAARRAVKRRDEAS